MSKFTIAIRLFIITAVATLFLALTNMVTAPITTANNKKAFNESLRDALPEAKVFKTVDFKSPKDGSVTVNSIHAGYKDDNRQELVGYVVKTTSSEGYGGDLCVIVGIDKNGEVTKAIISSPFNETAGLGAKAKKSDFIDQFKGKSGELKVVKREANGDSEISAISSATITSNAVTNCVNTALKVTSESAAKNSLASDEAQQTYTEKDEQSKAELDAINESRKDGPNPTIKDENDKEDDKNE